jgi:hypothetical protein
MLQTVETVHLPCRNRVPTKAHTASLHSDSESQAAHAPSRVSETKPLSDTDPRRLYNIEEFSDMQLRFPRPNGRKRMTIHAHKAILAAGSGYFRRELKLPKYNVNHHGDGDIAQFLLMLP